MNSEYFEIAWINFTKAILHGQFVDNTGKKHEVEHVLNDTQQKAVRDMINRHDRETQTLLREFAVGRDD